MTAPTQMRSISLKTSDLLELQDSAIGWDQQYSQLSPGKFKGALELREIGSRQIGREYFGRKVLYQGAAPCGRFAFALPIDQPGCANWVGKTVDSTTVIIQAPDQQANLVTSGHWDAIVLAVHEEDARAITAVLSGHAGLDKCRHGTCTLQTEVAAKLRREGLAFLCESKSAPGKNDKKLARWFEQYWKLFLWELVNAQGGLKPVVEPAKSAQLVGRATDIVMANPKNIVGLVDICRTLEVSLRTLHYAFQSVTGMSAATWLRTMRLNCVHKCLKQSDKQSIMIKELAVEYGFLHHGHFSALYRRHFGCLPSETLGSA